MKSVKSIVHQMAIDAWGAVTTILVVFLALETLERGFVSRFFNMLWLVLLVFAASLIVMATHPGVHAMDPAHRAARKSGALVQLAAVLAALAVWFLLPQTLGTSWRAAASVMTLLVALSVLAAFKKHE